jgi:hypothetical protein
MALMSYRRHRRPVAVARTVNWPAMAAAALTSAVSAGLWLCLANALLGR